MPEGPSIILLKEEGIQFSGKKSGVLAVTVILSRTAYSIKK